MTRMLHIPLADFDGSFWMPRSASSVAPNVDAVFNFILWITVFFFLLVVALLVFFVWRYRYRPGRKQESAPTHNQGLELTWTIIPTIVVLVIYYLGFRGYLHMAVAPPNAYTIDVNARMWTWSFTYPNGHTDNELHLPVDTPVQLVLSSDDVIHGFFIPAFRIKKDVVPGRYNKVWVKPTEIGVYDLYCSQYCGTSHSEMRAKVIVQDPDDFRNWLEKASNWETTMTPVEAGRMLYEKRGCMQCHTTDGSRLIGPSFKNLFGSEQVFTDGSRAIVDENFVRHFIFNPTERIPAGFDPVMPSFKGNLADKDVTAIIAYLKSISDKTRSQVLFPATRPTTAPVKD